MTIEKFTKAKEILAELEKIDNVLCKVSNMCDPDTTIGHNLLLSSKTEADGSKSFNINSLKVDKHTFDEIAVYIGATIKAKKNKLLAEFEEL